MFKGVPLWAAIISGGISQLKDTQALGSGQLDKKDYAIQTSKNVTGSVGFLAGIEYGGLLGSSILPGPGTLIGAVIGSFVGSWIGNYAGYQAGNIVFNKQIVNRTLLPHNEIPKIGED